MEDRQRLKVQKKWLRDRRGQDENVKRVEAISEKERMEDTEQIYKQNNKKTKL